MGDGPQVPEDIVHPIEGVRQDSRQPQLKPVESGATVESHNKPKEIDITEFARKRFHERIPEGLNYETGEWIYGSEVRDVSLLDKLADVRDRGSSDASYETEDHFDSPKVDRESARIIASIEEDDGKKILNLRLEYKNKYNDPHKLKYRTEDYMDYEYTGKPDMKHDIEGEYLWTPDVVTNVNTGLNERYGIIFSHDGTILAETRQ